jgi:hypothetical protein
MAALGMGKCDVFPPDGQPNPGGGRQRRARPAYRTPEEAIAHGARDFGEPVATYTYKNADGSETMRVCRFEFIDPETGERRKEFRPVYEEPDGWVVARPKGRLPLYHLPEVTASAQVFVCEGEKTADALRAIGLVTTTSAFGARSAGKSDWSVLAGKEVILMPDQDEAGAAYARAVVQQIPQRGAETVVKILRLEQLWKTAASIPDGADAVDWLAVGVPDSWDDVACRDFILQAAKNLATAALPAAISSTPEPYNEDGDGETSLGRDDRELKPARESQVELVLRCAEDARLFHTPDGKPYATVACTGKVEHLNIRSQRFKSWLTHVFFKQRRRPPTPESLQSAIGALQARALIEGDEARVSVRVAEHEGKLFVDLANRQREVIEVSVDGWRIVDDPPVKFRRPTAMMPLPTPSRDGSIEALRPLVNIGSDADWLLFVALLTFYLRPSGPFPILVLLGEQGCAKSTTARTARALVDPNSAPLRAQPREERDLVITASNSWLVVMDNLSHVPAWLSDALCRLATGGGFATRQLYADDEETIFDVTRPVIINGITDIVERPDLSDRSVFLRLPVIPEDKRLQEQELRRAIDSALPGVFGGMLDLIAEAMQILPTVTLSQKPRMADFALWGEAVCQAMGSPSGALVEAYNTNRRDANSQIVDDSVLAEYLRLLMEGKQDWLGRSKDLLDELNSIAGDDVKGIKEWPRSPRGLSGDLRRLAPVLRTAGLDFHFGDRTGPGRNCRLIRITRVESPSAKPPAASSAPSASGNAVDDPGGRLEPAQGRAWFDQPIFSSDAARRHSANAAASDGAPGRHADDADGVAGPLQDLPMVKEVI